MKAVKVTVSTAPEIRFEACPAADRIQPAALMPPKKVLSPSRVRGLKSAVSRVSTSCARSE